MGKVLVALTVAFVATVVAAKLAFEATVRTDSTESTHPPWAQHEMEFVAWNNGKWTAWIRNGEFELAPQDTGNWSRHANSTIAFIDWSGEPWQARMDGEMFVLAYRGDWKGATERANAIRYRDWSGENQLRTVAQLAR